MPYKNVKYTFAVSSRGLKRVELVWHDSLAVTDTSLFLHWIYKSQESEPQCNRSWAPVILLSVTDNLIHWLSVLQVYVAVLESRAPFSLVLLFRGNWLKCPVKEVGWSFTLKVHTRLDQSLLDLRCLLYPASYSFLVLLGLFYSVIATKPALNKLKEKADSKETFPKEISHLWVLQA